MNKEGKVSQRHEAHFPYYSTMMHLEFLPVLNASTERRATDLRPGRPRLATLLLSALYFHGHYTDRPVDSES